MTGLSKNWRPKNKPMEALRPQRSPAGFTLIEIVVTMAIMGVIMTLSLVNFSSITSSNGSKLGNETLVSDLRGMAQKALMKEYYQGRPTYGWGAYIDCAANSYTLFADFNGDKFYDPVEKFRTVTLDGKLKIIKGTLNGGEYTDHFSILFGNENAFTNVDGTWLTPDLGMLVLETKNDVGANPRYISISSLGVVDLQ